MSKPSQGHLSRQRVTIGQGHNSRDRLALLEKKVRNKQVAAQRAWLDLMMAQLKEDEPWAKVLASATMTGIKAEQLRTQLDVSPSTFSRWVSGHHAPSASFKNRLGIEIIRLAEQSKERVHPFDDAENQVR